jgi:hypothetical protein
VADDGRTAQAGQRRSDEQAVPLRRRHRQNAVDVGTAPEPGQLAGSDEAFEFAVGPPLLQCLAAEVESGLRRSVVGHAWNGAVAAVVSAAP